MAKSKDAPTKLLTKVSAVISLQNEDLEKAKAHLDILEKDFLSLECETYGAIIHDRDIDDDGKLKTLHIHLCFRLKKRVRKSTLINKVSSLCEVSPFAVTLDGATSFEGCFQYLIHKNDPQKFQYSFDEVRTNLTEGEIDIIMDAKTSVLDLPLLKAACMNTDCLVDVIEAVGLSTYQHYRATILDVFNWAQGYKAYLKKEAQNGKPKESDF